jgi:hypothetical protein
MCPDRSQRTQYTCARLLTTASRLTDNVLDDAWVLQVKEIPTTASRVEVRIENYVEEREGTTLKQIRKLR